MLDTIKTPLLVTGNKLFSLQKRYTVYLQILIFKKSFIQDGMIISMNPKQYVNQLIKILYLPLLEQVLLIAILSYIPSLSTALESSPTNCPPSRRHVHVTKKNKSNVTEEHVMNKLLLIY